MSLATALRVYRDYLEGILGKGPLYEDVINAVGNAELGDGWRGVSDQSTFKSTPGYHIVNTSYSKNSKGVHWLGVYVSNDKKIYIFDSYNRNVRSVSNKLFKKYGSAVRDPNDKRYQQGDTSATCGHASLAWLMIVRDYGIQAASTET